jgi:hypothetical protein
MTTVPATTTPATLAPSRRQLLIGTLVALIVAGVVLVTVILPAEYGVDPIGAGRLLGLTDMAAESDEVSAQLMHEHERRYLSGRVVITIGPGEGLEYKATLPAGEPLLYSWTVAGGPVYFEFHGEPTEGEWPEDYYRSYQIKQQSSGEHGSFVAPFTGMHGWYWKNLSTEPATITLEASGFYSRLGRVEG